MKGFLAGDDPAAMPVLELPASRALELRSPAEVPAIAEATFGDRLDPAARFFVEEVFAPDL